jgi:hypothetical protein
LLIISVLILLISREQQKEKWKGTIEEEDGVKVIKNPNEPLYGEIAFELEEDLSIGDKGENYSFNRVRGIAVDNLGNIYASDADNRRIRKYDREGRYLQTMGRTAQRDGALEQPMKVMLHERTGCLYVLDKKNRFFRLSCG